MKAPFISICIPAYKHAARLQHLLDSIAIQTFKDFEVVITDDSRDDEVRLLVEKYVRVFQVTFKKNLPALGTPENWNEAIRHAKGNWIKLMHDDDWFYDELSLQKFVDAIRANPKDCFFFSAYTNVYEGTNRLQNMFLKRFWKRHLLEDPNILIADNVIGPPSVTLHKNDGSVWYDRRMKYIVDIDFYIRYLHSEKPAYIPELLVKVGINKDQVTKYTFGVPEVHLREALQLLKKTGAKTLKNILVFDGWWRLIRNFSINDIKDVKAAGFEEDVPDQLKAIIAFQRKIPPQWLKLGVFSKTMMSVCYLTLRSKV
jgi:glycosyltransferase involved in cell wall biosynthesis